MHSGNSARSTATVGGTRVAPKVPPDWYKCHVCQSNKHYRNECPKEASVRAERQAAGATRPGVSRPPPGDGVSSSGKKILDEVWPATQPCHKGAACPGKDSWCAFAHPPCDLASLMNDDNLDRCLEISRDLDVIMREIEQEKLGIKIAYEICPQEAQHDSLLQSGLSSPSGLSSLHSPLQSGLSTPHAGHSHFRQISAETDDSVIAFDDDHSSIDVKEFGGRCHRSPSSLDSNAVISVLPLVILEVIRSFQQPVVHTRLTRSVSGCISLFPFSKHL